MRLYTSKYCNSGSLHPWLQLQQLEPLECKSSRCEALQTFCRSWHRTQCGLGIKPSWAWQSFGRPSSHHLRRRMNSHCIFPLHSAVLSRRPPPQRHTQMPHPAPPPSFKARHGFVALRAVTLLVLFTGSSGALGTNDVILPVPAAAGKGVPVAAIMLQGAQIAAEAYAPLLTQLQAACGMPGDPAASIALWAAVPQFPLSTVNPVAIAEGIKRVHSALITAGMPSGARVFLLGHSLGGAMLDLYVHDHPAGFSGAIFMGSFIARSRRSPTTGCAAYPVPSLTLAGELDGLSRVTRTGAEAFYAQVSGCYFQLFVFFICLILPAMFGVHAIVECRAD